MVETSHLQGFWPPRLEPFRTLAGRVADWFAPASDAAITKDAYEISLELPGVAEDDLEISVHDRVLSVTGEKSAEHEERGEHWYFRERQFGSFARSFRLPPDADGTRVSAVLKDGVLTLSIPRAANSRSEPRRIPIIRR
ncbi:glutamyl-tRNA amidotransferase subunit A [Roseivivax halodurans JCM 10272]|uniref:Glutamyl-tRNA amidotransferase subunit A n=1 Tax=Roseivivax halodurans JCM 10272 TaxID=1449350 RepID=X7EKY8_9RHOB|nr:HSP20 family small heat-shock protein [Roseivivax halodurans]ETX16582.1 glutamyl-tRNA amidotransferase subunit A [Roseivivax halodurans JCM 10272]